MGKEIDNELLSLAEFPAVGQTQESLLLPGPGAFPFRLIFDATYSKGPSQYL